MAATVGIGDGPNDGEMLAETAIAIAMGNASDDLKAVADHVTADVDKDGLFKAFKWLQVI